MANAKLHIICGNCGCDSMFEWSFDPKARDISNTNETVFAPEVYIKCGNCSTIHDLSDNADSD